MCVHSYIMRKATTGYMVCRVSNDLHVCSSLYIDIHNIYTQKWRRTIEEMDSRIKVCVSVWTSDIVYNQYRRTFQNKRATSKFKEGKQKADNDKRR